MICPNYKNEVSPEWKICPYCEFNPKLCSNPDCKSGWLLTQAHFCPVCGSPVKGEEHLNLKKKIETIMEADKLVYDNRYCDDNDIITVGRVEYKMVRVEAGSFLMGATPEQIDSYDVEKPVHRVSLSTFYIGETLVTQALWKEGMGDNPSNCKGDTLPVDTVSWEDCQEFLKQINSKTRKNFRLPTEAEWEFAARGGRNSQGYRYAGSNNLGDVAWFAENSGGKTHSVKGKQPNELGLYDMMGNVWEWCHDWEAGYDNSPQTNPKGPSSGSNRVLRGYSWMNEGIRGLSVRHSWSPDHRSKYYGFRLALSLQ